MASSHMSALASATSALFAAESTPAQGALDSAGAGITGGMWFAMQVAWNFSICVGLTSWHRLHWRLTQS
jgi:hypothetical protein